MHQYERNGVRVYECKAESTDLTYWSKDSKSLPEENYLKNLELFTDLSKIVASDNQMNE